MGVAPRRWREWTTRDVARLREHWRTPVPGVIIACALDRSPRAVYEYARWLGITGKPRARGARNVTGLDLLIRGLGLEPALLQEIAERTVAVLRTYEIDRAAIHAKLDAIAALLDGDVDEDEENYE